MKKTFFRQNKRILAIVCSAAMLFGSFACLGSAQVSAETTQPLSSGEATYDFDNNVPEYTVKRPYNIGEQSSYVSVAEDPANSENKVLKINWSNKNKAVGIDFNYVLESNTTYKISYRYKGDGNFKMQYEADTYYQSGFFKGTFENIEGWIGDDDSNANARYPISEKLAKFRDGKDPEVISSEWTTVTRTFTTDTVDDSKKYLSLALNIVENDAVTAEYVSLYLDDIIIKKIDPYFSAYDFDTEVPEYTVKKPYNMGTSSYVSVANDPADSENKVLEIKWDNKNKAVGIDFNYVLESNTTYKISYRYKGDGNFKLQGEADKYYQSGFFKGTFEDKNSVFEDNANTVYLISEKLAKFRDGTKEEVISSEWTTVTRVFTTDTVDDSKKYLSLALNIVKNKAVAAEYVSLYLDDIYIQKISKDNAAFDFENSNEYLDLKINNYQNNHKNAKVEVKTENSEGSTTNSYLTIKAKQYQSVMVNFPFEFENNTEYKISYKIKSETNNIKLQYSTAGFYVGKSTGVFDSTSAKAWADGNSMSNYRTTKLADLYDVDNQGYTKAISSGAWTEKNYVFKTGESDVSEDFKYLCLNFVPTEDGADAEGYSTVCIDDIVIAKVINLDFGDDADAIAANLGSKVELPAPNVKLGYTFTGWYDSDEKLVGTAGDEITCPAVAATYHAKWEKNTSCTVNFEDGSYAPILSSGVHTPEVVTDPDDENNKVLKTDGINNNTTSQYKFTLPVELQKDVTYTVSFKYKVKLANGENVIQLQPTGQDTQGNSVYNGSYIALADNQGVMQGKPLTLLFGDGNVDIVNGEINWNGPNKIRNTDWQTRTFTFTADENANEKFATLQLYIYYDRTADDIIYFDDISVQKTPTATFETGEGATKIENITVAPGTVITPACPTRAGYTFKGWYVGDKYAGFSEITMPNEDVTYTAKWERVLSAGNVDADENNTISGDDLVALRKILLGMVDKYEIALADCTGDGRVDILDLIRLKKYLANSDETVLGKTVDGVNGYRLVWSEEFNGTALDSDSFVASQTQGNVDGITYTDEQISVSDGTLKLAVVKNEDGTVNCAKGVITDNTMNFKHGYIEVRAKLPYLGKGEWPAIWSTTKAAKLAGVQNERSVEFDLAENMGSGTLKSQLHNWGEPTDYANLIKSQTEKELKSENGNFHTYGMLWTKDYVKFYLDGEMYASYEFGTEELSKELADQLISMRIGDGFNAESGMSLSELPEHDLEVDYVRLYQIPGDSVLISKK